MRVTDWLLLKVDVQVAPQLMPLGLLDTVPLPDEVKVRRREVPPSDGSEGVDEPDVKVADTAFAEDMVTWQVDVPVHAPPHPANVEPDAAVAVNVTTVPGANDVPEGLAAIVPVPVPAVDVVRVKKLDAAELKIALTVMFSLTVTGQVVPVPQLAAAPVQPANVEPDVAVAVNVTTAPAA